MPVIYWCDDRNVPILSKELGSRRCASLSIVRLTRPGDVRPAFPVDIEITRNAIINEFGSEELARRLIPDNEVILLNKIPGYADQADEVIVRGRVIGHRFYDVERKTWRFRPLYEGVAEIMSLRLGYWAIVNMDKLPQRYDVHANLIMSANLPSERYRHVAVSTRDGSFHGVAKLMRGSRLRIIKSWRARDPLPSPRPSSLKDFVELNRDYLERKAQKALEFLRKVFSEYKLPIVVSFSGGKDSLVVLDLTARTGVKFHILFNDTGLEAPETYEFVEEIATRYNAELITASAGDKYWRAINEFGPPARDYRWCCKVIKLGPITDTLIHRFPNGYISVVGQRALESFQRARLPMVSRSKWVTKDIVVAPIQDWSALEVWGYIIMNGLPYNKAYEYGFDRLGCVICPANELAEFELVEERYPGIYTRLGEVLRKYAEEKGLGQDFVRLGLWRWRREIPGDMARYVKVRLRVDYPIRISRSDDALNLVSARGINYETLGQFLKMVGRVERTSDGYLVKGKLGEARVVIKGDNSVSIITSDGGLAVHIAGLVSRASICGECNLCINWCPTKALSRLGPGPSFTVDESRCINCLLCSTACPSAQYLVYRNPGLRRA
ncbi:phosphoadenosine phosphosulfate reductase domain-containing protein [Vulcanisaeta thermophila]|uniref:phosphoadenosine phosphosulfate reductase domain-containing protein n=1 Tax=Vulcanisaeta thermophila TaxID=867917 RepID=UPI000852AA70|nr:phosphoadenosine phosphosulfate reductase family protein [Vulcanisaeta thermophila]